MAKNITIIPASGSINFISSGSSSTIELLITGSNNEILTFYTGSTPILSINSTSGFSTAQPPSFNNLSSVPSSSNYVVYDTGSGAISYTTGVGGSGTSGTSGTGTSGTSGNSGTSGTSGTSADLSAYVPYTGATSSVNLGANNLTATAGTFSGTFAVGTDVIYRVSGSSKVSFGTTVQNYQFTLYATGNDNRLHFLNNSTGTAVTDGTFIGLDDGINFSFWQRENGYIRFGTNETERLRITAGGLLTFAGASSSFPALKRNSTELQVRLADDSAFAPLISGRFEANQTSISINSIATAITTGSFIGANISSTQIGLLVGTDQSGFSYIQGRYGSGAEHIRIQEFGSGISVGSATGDGYIGIGRTSQLASSRLGISVAPTASANYGLVSLGSGAFDGATSGFFTGVAAGTVIAVNLASGGTSDLLNMQVAGVNRFKVSSVGQVDIISTATNQLVVQSTGTAVDSRASMLLSNNRASFASVAAFLYGNTTNTSSKLGQTMADKFFIIADGANNLGMAIGTNGNVPLFLATNNSTRLTVTGGGLLAFGTGITSAFPALKRNSTELQVRLADDSAFAPLQASQLTISAGNIITDTTTGMKIGTGTTQKLGFWNATPIIQPISGGSAATFVANTSLIANDTATFDGYTIGQVVKALRDMGILA